MNSDWLVNGSGSITVSNSGSLIEDAQYRSILFNGGVVFTNYGTTEMTSFAFTNGAEAHNFGTLSLDTGLYVDQNSTFMNHGLVKDVDSTFTQGMFMNEGTYSEGDFLNEGMMTNTGYITADSLLNTGTLNTSAGSLNILDFGNSGELNVTGGSYIIVNNDFWNSGKLYLAAGRDIRVANDMANTHQSGTASINNDGLIEIGNDFSNIDTLRGSGLFCIANNSLNTGDVKETLDICDNSGTSYFDVNTGNIDPTVTNCISGCNVGIEEDVLSGDEISIYPNPASTLLNIDANTNYKMLLVDVMGNIILDQKVDNLLDVSNLKTGVYFIKFTGTNFSKTLKFVKK
jgi:acyl-CoA synthetase (AMP-forming)/AMP-acid ligase II